MYIVVSCGFFFVGVGCFPFIVVRIENSLPNSSISKAMAEKFASMHSWGIRIVIDMAIYVGHHCADVWVIKKKKVLLVSSSLVNNGHC
jgi:hypothetical protein